MGPGTWWCPPGHTGHPICLIPRCGPGGGSYNCTGTEECI
jgi:hypothetical protein